MLLKAFLLLDVNFPRYFLGTLSCERELSRSLEAEPERFEGRVLSGFYFLRFLRLLE